MKLYHYITKPNNALEEGILSFAEIQMLIYNITINAVAKQHMKVL